MNNCWLHIVTQQGAPSCWHAILPTSTIPNMSTNTLPWLRDTVTAIFLIGFNLASKLALQTCSHSEWHNNTFQIKRNIILIGNRAANQPRQRSLTKDKTHWMRLSLPIFGMSRLRTNMMFINAASSPGSDTPHKQGPTPHYVSVTFTSGKRHHTYWVLFMLPFIGLWFPSHNWALHIMFTTMM